MKTDGWQAYYADDVEQKTPITRALEGKKVIIKYTGDKKVKKVEVIKEE